MAVSSDARAAQDSKFEAVSEAANKESSQKLSAQGWDKNDQGFFARKNQNDEADIDNLLAQADLPAQKAEEKSEGEEPSLDELQNMGGLTRERQMQIIEHQLKIADEVFAEQLKRASTPEVKADIYRKIAENHFFMGDQYMRMDNKQESHLEHMKAAKSNFNTALKELEGRDSDKLERAKMLGDLAFAERCLATKIGDEDIKNAELHYQQAIDLLKAQKTPADDQVAQNQNERLLMYLYNRQGQLYNLIRQPEKAIKAQDAAMKIFVKHPEWQQGN
ncbi:MAG: hypothetical protein K2W82_07930 [Candidatus Obscuribacterales bacterium]|nr:hypothetical protein [Candidatus Obscuribacterales bacterium]